MNRHLHAIRTALAALLLLACTYAAASDIRFVQGENTTRGILEEEAQLHLHAMQNALQQTKYAAFVNDESLMRKLRQHTVSSTVARVEYTYKGTRIPRVYRARSGRSIGGTLRWLSEQGSPTGSGSTSGSDGSWAADIEEDLADQRFYPRLGANEVRVSTRPQKYSQLRPSESTRGRDAELKALRELEADLNRGIVPPGGELEIFVSQPPCSSCSQAITQFSRAHKLRTTVNHLTSTRDVRRSDWNASQKAYSEFFRNREKATGEALVTGKVQPPGFRSESETLDLLERAESFESGRLKVAGATCVP